jgi:hypothetical protein
MASIVILDQKSPEATITAQFNFASLLTNGQTITTINAVTATVWAGTDANPQNIIQAGQTISGLIVNQNLTGGVAGVIYKIRCAVTASDGQVPALYAYLAVVEDPL